MLVFKVFLVCYAITDGNPIHDEEDESFQEKHEEMGRREEKFSSLVVS